MIYTGFGSALLVNIHSNKWTCYILSIIEDYKFEAANIILALIYIKYGSRGRRRIKLDL